jgi:dTMP kinase
MPKRGRLIALEGGGSPAMELASKQLLRSLKKTERNTGLSSWDGSGLFYDMAQAEKTVNGASPRVLMLLYASDLVFRLRWQIEPALEAGQTVVACCYVESAIAFGRSVGIPRPWLRDLFAFAPKPDKVYRAPEESLAFNRRGQPATSFLEYCFVQLRRSSGWWQTEDVRKLYFDQLRRLEARGGCELWLKSSS